MRALLFQHLVTLLEIHVAEKLGAEKARRSAIDTSTDVRVGHVPTPTELALFNFNLHSLSLRFSFNVPVSGPLRPMLAQSIHRHFAIDLAIQFSRESLARRADNLIIFRGQFPAPLRCLVTRDSKILAVRPVFFCATYSPICHFIISLACKWCQFQKKSDSTYLIPSESVFIRVWYLPCLSYHSTSKADSSL